MLQALPVHGRLVAKNAVGGMQGAEAPGPPANEGAQDEIDDEELLQMAFADYEPQQQVPSPSVSDNRYLAVHHLEKSWGKADACSTGLHIGSFHVILKLV